MASWFVASWLDTSLTDTDAGRSEACSTSTLQHVPLYTPSFLWMCVCLALRWCSEASCGALTSLCSPHSLLRTVGSSSSAAWWAVGSQECPRGQHRHNNAQPRSTPKHTHTQTQHNTQRCARVDLHLLVVFQLRVEDGVHPLKVSSRPAASGHCEFCPSLHPFKQQYRRNRLKLQKDSRKMY